MLYQNLKNKKADFLRNIKKVLVKIFFFFIPKPTKIDCLDSLPKSIVILAQERLGDSILLTPLLKKLKQTLPNSEITVIVVSDDSYNFFLGDQNINHLIYAKQNYVKNLIKIRRQKYDLLFNTKDHLSFTFVILTAFIKARTKVGIYHKYHQNIYNYLLEISFHEHIVVKNCALLKFLKLDINEKDCRPYILEHQKVNREIIDFSDNQIATKKVIGINLSAGDVSREWSVDKWKDLLSKINMEIIVFSMPKRIKDKYYLEENLKNVIESPETPSINDVAYLMKKLKLIITPDTSLMHIASCYKIPVICLYRNNPLHHKRFYPYLTPHAKIISQTENIEDISVDEVVKTYKSIADNL